MNARRIVVRAVALLIGSAAGLSGAAAVPPSDAYLAALAKADLGDASSEYTVGEWLENGIGVTPNRDQGLMWLQKAADQNYPPAPAAIGFLYKEGLGVPKDATKAFPLFLQSAKLGDSYGEREAGECYLAGKGVAQDVPSAMNWFKAAAAQGDPVGQTRLGLAYCNGSGGMPKDDKQAFTYFLSAAYDNFGWAQYNVGRCYYYGVFVPRDGVQAYKWLKIAHATYHDPAEESLLFAATNALKVDQIIAGDKLVQNWPVEKTGQIQTDAFHAKFAEGQRTSFAFDYHLGLIVVNVAIEGRKDLRFMVDTGASTTLLSDAMAAQLGFTGTSYMPVRGFGSDIGLSALSDGHTLALPGLTMDHVNFNIASLDNLRKQLPITIDGILGFDILNQFVVHIDYVNKKIELSNPQVVAGTTADSVLALSSVFPPAIEVKVVNNGITSPTAKLEIDCGTNIAISLGQGFVLNNENLGLSGGLKSQGFGIGGAYEDQTVTCSKLLLGEVTLPNVVIQISRNTTGSIFNYEAGFIGNDILHRFDVTMDFLHRKLYLKKNAFFDDPYETSHTGLSVALGPDNKTLSVLDIVPNSPAARAGFRIGDVLILIDGTNLDSLRQDDASKRFRAPGTHHVQVRRDGQLTTLELVMAGQPTAASSPSAATIPPPTPALLVASKVNDTLRVTQEGSR